MSATGPAGGPPRFDGADAGTAHADWLASAALREAPVLEAEPSALLVVAAHPDDEVLGAYGSMLAAARRGAAVTVVVATDGEGSHPGSPTVDPTALARLRRAEHEASLAGLGARIVRLGLPDGALQERRRELVTAIAPLVAALPEDGLVIAPWAHDGHPDHEAVGDASAAVARELGRVCAWAPIWSWLWGEPGLFDGAALRRVPLDDAARAAKATAIAAHRSQVAPLSPHPADRAVLTPTMLERFAGDEWLLLAPPAAATAFDDRYAGEGDPWSTRDSWYERRKRQVVLAALPEERYRLALEVGCGTATLTAELAGRCDGALGVDASIPALAEARRTIAGAANAWIEHRAVEHGLPAAAVDLVVLSEIGSYVEPRVLRGLVEQARDRGAHMVLCHWRGEGDDLLASADEVHALAVGVPGLRRIVEHRDERFLVDVLVPA
ncbi:bifunctional PIG-L family deacetylase/class I SAM-dependent methyltransferase [Agrococcus sp. BE272]|uniref:bifunctional PIG-L family deacetylase/class I SAM-dependent methyltransferase n=1 Tax=Agrococcus sp. BE272 TaxID=2817727 RepID=UPI0028566608|nr:bifunctional PIG-L family deacetylase/class I SAM-dependent methyltransferase [Agrococcus sp. BE272]MDR7234079.1 LmbE family N-acetylglucosaminyl deacetylase [Agrococcus sp. BE272]